MYKKKVLVAATVYTHLANFHKPAIKLLQEKGYEVHAAANDNEGRKEEIEDLGVTCHIINFVRSPFNKQNILAVKQISSLLKGNYFELIHVHTPIASFIVRYIGKKHHQGPILYTAHGFHFYKGAPILNWCVYYLAERIAKKWTDGLIVINNEDFNQGKRMGFTTNKDLFLINGVGVNLNIYNKNCFLDNNFRYEYNIPLHNIVVTCVAEFTKNKNQQFLIKAWREIIRDYTQIHLVFVGEGERQTYLKNMVLHEKIRNIHFLGFRNDVQQILKNSDVIALVSNREGLPKSIIEGMAYGLPAIVTNVRGSRDLISHGENGYLVGVDNVKELIESLRILIERKEIRETMGKSSLQRINRYSLEIIIKEIERIYQAFLR